MASRLLTLALLLGLTVWMGVESTPSFAAQKGEQRALREALGLFKQGRMALKAKDFDAALKLFRKAQATYEHEPLIILALATTLDNSGQQQKALRYYAIFLEQVSPTDPDRARTLTRIAAIKTALAARPAQLVLKGLPTGAQVWLDGKIVQVDANNTLKMPAGVHGVKVVMGRRIPYARRGMALAAGQRLVLDVVLLEPVDESKLRRDHTWTWVAGGTTAVAALAAGIFAVRGTTLRNSYGELADLSTGKITAAAREEYTCVSQKPEDCPKLIAEVDSRRQAIDDNAMLIYATGIGAGVFGIVTLVAYLTAPVKKDQGAALLQWTPTLSGDRAGMAVTLRF